MPAEHDDESTRFDSRPWGGQQRLIPLGHRFVRPAASPADDLPTTPDNPAAIAPPRRTAKGTRQPRLSAPVDHTSAPVPSMTNPASIGDTVSTIAMPAYVGSQPMPIVSTTAMPTIAMRPAAMHAPAEVAAPMPAPIAAAAPTRASAIPAYSVKHGRAIGGFIVPHLPKVAQVFTSEERTVAVRRRPMTQRSMIAVPLGVLSALVTILIIYFTQPAPTTKPTALGASALQTETERHVMKATLEPETERHVMTATVEPTTEVAATIVADQVAAVDTAADATDDTETASADRPSRRRAHASKRQSKPRRIVAVDSSTPLGNLRPGRM